MPPLASARASPALWLGLAVAACLLLPTAGAEITGEVRYELASPEEAEIEGTLNLTGEAASDLRERVDRDDDGEVGSLEAAGARSVLDERLQGETDAYTLDGANYTNEEVRVSTEGLKGPVEANTTLRLDVTIRAQTRTGSAPHVFAIHGPPTDLADDAEVTHVVVAPEGYRVAEAEGFAEVETCAARTDPGVMNASLELEAHEGACSRPNAMPAGGAAVVGTAIVAALAASRAGRRKA